MNADNADNVFTSSTPETRPDWCDSVGRWRVSHADRLREIVKSIDEGGYVAHHRSTPSGRQQLFAGIRDNRDPVEHSDRCKALRRELKSIGLKVKYDRAHGRVVGVIVTDRLTNEEA